MVFLGSFWAAALATSLFAPAQVYGNTLVSRQTTGDKKCTSTMCITATVNGSDVEYVLSSLGTATLGWMGIGFGRQMANTPMVIMWPNSDGSVTLSQRTAPREQQPTLDSNPPRVAQLVNSLTSTSGSTPSFGFKIPSDGTTGKQTIIYAFGTTAPSSSSPDATIQLHVDNGALQLDLGTSGSSTATGTTPGSTSTSASGSFPNDGLPLLHFQKLVIVHAIFCVVGFLLFLPAGALLARWFRTFTPVWFKGHWIIQFLISGVTITIGFALGVQAVSSAGGFHFNDIHKQLGLALFVLYWVQCSLGSFIHFVKPKDNTRRPIQNYLHAIFGLLIIALSMYQVGYGFKVEWSKTTGMQPFPTGVSVLFYIWIVLLPISYFAGLTLLRRQYKQEDENRLRTLGSKEEDLDDEHQARYRDRE